MKAIARSTRQPETQKETRQPFGQRALPETPPANGGRAIMDERRKGSYGGVRPVIMYQ
jgi:hypothetical protein